MLLFGRLESSASSFTISDLIQERYFSSSHFYEQLDTDSNQNYADTIRKEIDNLKSKSKITNKEHVVLTEHLSNPRTPVFYGLPKLHKNFSKFPPLRPIVSGFSSCSNRLSEFLDGFLKYQAQKTNSYIRDTKDFLVRLADLPSLPSNTILVTMDVASLYTNIDHEEGANACFDHLEQRNKKSISSSYLKKLILLVLRVKRIPIWEQHLPPIKGTAMGTPMAPNYANLFMASLETKMLDEYYELTKLRPLVWYRYIDDIFFIWTHGNESLNQFIDFCNNFSKNRKMKSTIQYETHQSTDSVNFLDVERVQTRCVVENAYKDVLKSSRESLFRSKEKDKQDQQSIFVCTWHPALRHLSSLLRQNFNIVKNDITLSTVFPSTPTVAFRRRKTIANKIVRNDILERPPRQNTTKPCGKCKLCPNIVTQSEITHNCITKRVTNGGSCKTKNVVYAARCKIHDKLYVGHTGEALSTRFSKHSYDIGKRPKNSELAEHFHRDHSFADLEVMILESDFSSSAERERAEDKWMCRLQTLAPSGLNKDCHGYAKEVYQMFRDVRN
ncbi:uncharacterized protein [Clytia hemisphaerica]|uniref:uncharacterized protein n=1 Tax=Clytia hemisphaerica TaxID=252671 RepID=UPI0034D3AE2F